MAQTQQQLDVDNGKLNEPPFYDIARLKVQRNTGPKHGSGLFINQKYILTAAHNVADIGVWHFSSRVQTIKVSLGYKDDENAYWESPSVYRRKSIRWSSGYKPRVSNLGRYGFTNDYAIINLGDEVIDRNSSFRLPEHGEIKRLVEENKRLYFSGFPGEKFSGKRMMHAYTDVIKLSQSGTFISYPKIKTYRGNSGGPVWIVGSEGENILAGIHVTGNKAVLLDDKILSEVLKWMK